MLALTCPTLTEKSRMAEAPQTNFAGRLKELREAAGLTQQQLAQRAGLHKLSVAKLEQGLREPSWATVQALAAALGVDCQAFQETPAPRPATGPGRPPKPPDKSAAPKRPRGRPRKGESTEEPAADQEADKPEVKGRKKRC
ncbi:MAG TPA: helix-turn-helix transcriptional regulator [Gemmataceae bacterium]|nr:helix-turn-helix transcriptional regulator [Gemmataceae bacterium]